MTPAQLIMSEALAAVLQKAPNTQDKIAFAWRVIVGPAIDRATTVELRGTMLHVTAKDPTWRREVERSAGQILARLKKLLGDDVVHRVEIHTS